ncbi:MAG: hypothetical protein EOM18_17240, partial [Clostridia bacterium]|nr:hypothetical protein [Clostridia bacterium]
MKSLCMALLLMFCVSLSADELKDQLAFCKSKESADADVARTVDAILASLEKKSSINEDQMTYE